MTQDGGGGDVTLRILQVAAGPGPAEGVFRLMLQTTRGDIEGLFHPVEGGTAAVITAGGAMGGVDGPGKGLYGRLPELLAEGQVTVLRLEYRMPNVFDECVADILAGCSFMKGIGAEMVALIGHSFGAAVVIKAGELWPGTTAVAALSPQLFGTHEVERLGCPLLLVHGTADQILSHEASEDIYRRAPDPKRIVLFDNAGHGLSEPGDRLDEVVGEWLLERFRGEPMASGRSEYVTDGQ
jgi:alpha-beta hydrolase superfamily lysophospholipase